MNQKIWLSALALSLSRRRRLRATRNPNIAADPDAQQPQPEAVKGPPAAVAPAPFRKTVWRQPDKPGNSNLSGPFARLQSARLVVDDFRRARRLERRGQRLGKAKSNIPSFRCRILHFLQAGNQRMTGLAWCRCPWLLANQSRGTRTIWGVNTHFGQRDTPDEAYRNFANRRHGRGARRVGLGALRKRKGRLYLH